MNAKKELAKQGVDVRVVSMPSTDLFDQQPADYREKVLPKAVTKRMAIEMAASQTWYQYTGLDGAVFGIDKFGASAPGAEVIKNYGFTTENVVKSFKDLLNK